jgi:hypothetical protein
MKFTCLNPIFRVLVPGALALLWCSCAATSIRQTWKAPGGQRPAGKIAVITVDERGMLRQGFENRFVRQLGAGGAEAQTTFDVLTLPAIKEDKRAAAQRLRAGGATSVLILRLVDKTTSDREYQQGRERYMGVVTGMDTLGWYDYYSVGFVSLNANYASTKDKLYLETSLFDLNTEKRLWSALTRSVMDETMDRVGEMDVIVAEVVAAMRKDGMIP